MALSELAIRKAKPGEQDYKLPDGGGLYLLVRPNGSKLWRMNYRFLGTYKTLSIGRYPDVGLAVARDKCHDARRLVADGLDPSDDKKAKQTAAKLAAASTFEAVAEEYVIGLQKKGFAERTIAKNRWILSDLVCPLIGRRPISGLRPSDVLEILHDIEDSGRIETAHRARHVIGAVFRLAALSERAATDPTVVLRGQLRARKVEHRAAITNEVRFGTLMIDAYPGHPSIRAGLLFLAYTFVRPGELRFAVWDEIDIEDSVWHVPAERTKMRREHDVPLVHTKNVCELDGSGISASSAASVTTAFSSGGRASWTGDKGGRCGGVETGTITILHPRACPRPRPEP